MMLIGIDARMYGFSGIGTYLKALLRGLGEVDRKNRYICYLSSKDARRFIPPSANFSVGIWDIPIYSIKEQVMLPGRIAEEAFDVFHFPHYSFPLLARCRKVITIHDIIHYLFPRYLPNRLARFYARFMISACLRLGDGIITDSQNTQKDLKKYFYADPRKVRMIYPGLPDNPQPVERKEGDADSGKLRITKPYLLYVGNAKEHKNIPLLIRAFAAVREKIPCRLALSCRREEIGDRIEDSDLNADISFLGHLDKADLSALYRNAAAFIFPSLYEGFGYPPLEAMSHGVPVISSNASSLPEVLGDAALLVPPDSVDLLAGSIYNLLTDNDLRDRLIQRGFQRSGYFNRRVMAEKTLKVYEEIGKK